MDINQGFTSGPTFGSTAGPTEEGTLVLVVDDSITQLELLRFLLENAGYRVSTALDGEKGLESVRQEKPALIISDIVMPVMNGYELCGILKRDPLNQDIPIMLLTRLADVEDIIVGLEAKADYYITKPYNEDFLLSRVRLLLDSDSPRSFKDHLDGLEVTLAGKSYVVSAERRDMLNLLLSTYENAIQRNRELVETQRELRISHLLLAEQTRRAETSEQNYLTVLQNSLDAMIVVNSESRIIFHNTATERLLGKESSELLGKPFELPLNIGVTSEVDLGSPGSQKTIAELRVVETKWGEEVAYLASLRDITDRKRYEVQIQIQQMQLHEVNVQLRALASLDVMTGLANFRAFKERLDIEVSRSKRYDLPLSLVLLDIDRFKEYNDVFGHLAGDEALNTVAGILQQYVRSTDFPARYGGEELVVLLPNTDAVGAVDLAQRLRVAMEQHDWKLRSITASFGVATLDEAVADDVDLLAAADKAMYQSKFSGRNRVTHINDVIQPDDT
jgi:two-component system cell cycle response regulator